MDLDEQELRATRILNGVDKEKCEQMNIEEAIDILKNSIADYVIGEYCEKCADNKICDDRNEDCYYQQAIDIVVTAYEKEKEKNKSIVYNYEMVVDKLENSTSNDKIKAKIEDYTEKAKHPLVNPQSREEYTFGIRVLQSLLEKE